MIMNAKKQKIYKSYSAQTQKAHNEKFYHAAYTLEDSITNHTLNMMV